MTPHIVTLDGPAGVGKSTLARRVAEALGIAFLDTGAMFRTIALGLDSAGLLREGAGGSALDEHLAGYSFALQGSGNNTVLLCNGRAVGQEVRAEKAGMLAAKVAAWPEVRECLKIAQQRLGREFSLVAEGRDTGTVIFPNAQCKIFLDASPEVRGMRRYLQLQEAGQTADLAELTEQIRKRDEQDRNRPIAPLKAAEDAHIIDTSHIDVEGVFSAIMKCIG